MHKGFSLVELLIVISIMLIMAAVAVPIYGNMQTSSQLNENSTLIAQTIRIARQNSISRLNNSNYGVKFFTNSFVIYQGASYSARVAAYDRTTTLDSALTLVTTLTNNEINFTLGTGMPNVIGVVTLNHATGGTKTITINSYGIGEVN